MTKPLLRTAAVAVALATLFARSTNAEELSRRDYYVVPACAQTLLEELRSAGVVPQVLREDVFLTGPDDPEERVSGSDVGLVKAGTILVPAETARQKNVQNLLNQRRRPNDASPPDSETVTTDADCAEFVTEISVGFPLLIAPLPKPRPEDEPLKPITFETVYGLKRVNFNGNLAPPVRWLPDGEHYLQVRERRLYRVEARTGRASLFHDAESLKQALANLPTLDDEAATRIATGTRVHMNPDCTGFLFQHAEDLYFATFDGKRVLRLTSTPAAEELPHFSPNGAFVAFVRDYDMYVVDVETQTERQLTTGGDTLRRNGKADWVYYEELFHRDWLAYRWSPDSEHLAFLHFDDTHVGEFTVLDSRSVLQRVERTRYPLAGTANPLVKLGIVSVAGGPIRWVSFESWTPSDLLISGFGWTPDGKSVYFFAQNRTQQWLDFCLADVDAGETKRLFRDESGYWVGEPEDPRFVSGDTFFWLSERDGWKHLYRVEIGDKVVSQEKLTFGDWEVRDVVAVDEESQWVYLTGTLHGDLTSNLYRIRFDGSGLTRVTSQAGTHTVDISPNHRWCLDEYSSHQHPPRIKLLRTDGTKDRIVDSNPVPQRAHYQFGAFEFAEIITDDGTVLEGSLVKPPGFSKANKYPVWFTTYGGPHAPHIRDAWLGGRLFDQLLANMGLVVFRCDPRSASGKGLLSAGQAYRRLGVQELKDIEDAIEWLIDQGYVDESRIGMSGHSYGGFLTAYAMTHSKRFSAGIAGAPVTDWRNYDSIYTERYMGLPQDNVEGYRNSSVVRSAKNLHGRLLILHGEMDDNVHLSNTLQLVQALQEADRDFELMLYPGRRHGLSGRHYHRTVVNFIRRTMGVDEEQ